MSGKIAVIGGTGIYSLKFLSNIQIIRIKTSYGEVRVRRASLENSTEVFFMPRHGSKHTVAPHLVNYRGNIAALKYLGVQKIFAAAAVGSLRREMPPGSMVIIDQFIDQTRGRPSTFYSGEGQPVVHTDFTEPYCPDLRKVLIDECRRGKLYFSTGGTYVTTEGPRFETPAEIRAYSRLGGDLVGMTNVPEVVLAREAGICYAAVALVTNYAAGISPDILTHEEVLEVMKLNEKNLSGLFLSALNNIPETTSCRCGEAGVHFRVEGEIVRE